MVQDPFSRFVSGAAYCRHKLSYEGRKVARAARLIPEGSRVVDVEANIGGPNRTF
jgi:hypothetical protein